MSTNLNALQVAAAKVNAATPGAAASESPVRWRDRGVVRREVVYSVLHQKLLARTDGGEWDLRNPVKPSAAVEHLRSLGVSAGAAEELLLDRRYNVIHGVDRNPRKAEFFRQSGQRILNTYRSPALTIRKGEFPGIMGLLTSVTGGDDEATNWLMNWMAAKVQEPGLQSLTAPVLVGAPGIGKTKLGLVLAEILGERNCATLGPADLRSKFNASYVDKLLVVANEIVGPQVSRDFENRFKAYVTDPTVMLHDKYVRSHHRQNRMSWWLTSNNLLPLRLDSDDRRFTVIENRRPASDSVRRELEGLHAADGRWSRGARVQIGRFAHHLQHYRVDRELARRPLKNEARDRLIQMTRLLEMASQQHRRNTEMRHG